MTPFTDGYEPMEPIAPGQADPEPVENILEPRCDKCERRLEPTSVYVSGAYTWTRELRCPVHGVLRTPFDT